jgi:NADH dehydrogenase [ubiquinone] 1 alpha subcomplex assembly factor 7
VADTELGALIDAQIRANGPMSVAEYMSLCLGHPRRGYYTSGDPLGAAGDFVTAPEISQMFGELIGFFFVNLWQQMGEPPSFTLLELGPGRGTLMQDALRAASRATGFTNALHLQLFEGNPDLRAQQATRLGQDNPYWANEIDAVADDPLFVVANEFFDALPIRQFVKAGDGWHERQIGLRDGRRMFGLSPALLVSNAMPAEVSEAEPGSVLEVGIAAAEAMARLSTKISALGGAILAIDYGYARTQTGETLQAVRDHKFVDPLEVPGDADISAHVNFGALREVAARAGLTLEPLTSQGEWLTRLGIDERTSALARANPAQAAAVAAQRDRLVAPDQMGDLFKVFCAHSPGLAPAGFE